MATADQTLITFGEVVGALRRRWRVLVVFALLGVVLGLFVAQRGPGLYTAESQLVIEPITTDPFAANSRPIDAVSPATERSVLLGSTVASEVIRRLNLSTDVTDLLSRVSAENPEGSLTLRVSASASTPERAKALADTFAAVYLDQRAANAQTAIDALVEGIDTELGTASTELAEAISRASGVEPLSFEAQQIEAQISSLRARIASLEARRTELLSARTSPGRITREADLPTAPDGLPPLAKGLGVLLAASAAGVAAALLLDRRGGVLRDRSALEAATGGARVRILEDAEQVRSAVGTVVFDADLVPSKPPIVLLTDVGATPHASLTDELAYAFAASGKRPLVVWTGDRQHRPNGQFVETSLEDICDGAPPLAPSDERRAGPAWITPASGAGAAALARETAARRIGEWALASGYDVVVVATPSPRHQPAVASLARRVDEVAVVAKGLPLRESLVATMELLEAAGVAAHRLLVTTAVGPAPALGVGR
jgi:hypothetical protein